MNAPTSSLISLGCKHDLFTLDGEQPGNPQCYQGSYFDVTIIDPGKRHDEENPIALASGIVKAMALQRGNDAASR